MPETCAQRLAGKCEQVEHPTAADGRRIYFIIDDDPPFHTIHAQTGLSRWLESPSSESIVVLDRLWRHDHKASGTNSSPRLPYGPTSFVDGAAHKLEKQQKHVILWLALLHHHEQCYSCNGKLDSRLLLEHGQLHSNSYCEWHHHTDPPPFHCCHGSTHRSTYATHHPERFVGRITSVSPGSSYGTLDQLAVEIELPKCAPVHGLVQPGKPMHCHDMAAERRRCGFSTWPATRTVAPRPPLLRPALARRRLSQAPGGDDAATSSQEGRRGSSQGLDEPLQLGGASQHSGASAAVARVQSALTVGAHHLSLISTCCPSH